MTVSTGKLFLAIFSLAVGVQVAVCPWYMPEGDLDYRLWIASLGPMLPAFAVVIMFADDFQKEMAQNLNAISVLSLLKVVLTAVVILTVVNDAALTSYFR